MKLFNVLTVYPDMYPGPLQYGTIGKALENVFNINVVNLRNFDKNTYVDDRPFGGGPGMVMKAEPVHQALESIKKASRLVFLTPRGKRLTHSLVTEYAKCDDITILCGAFEGVDQRVIDKHSMEEISIGDFILPTGDYACFVLISSIVRVFEGVMSNSESAVNESHSGGLLSHAQYTRPELWHNISVPNVLTCGNHRMIKEWRESDSLRTTQKYRPDLWDAYLKLI